MHLMVEKILLFLIAVVIGFTVFAQTAIAQNQSKDYESSIKEINTQIQRLTRNLNANKAQRKTERDNLLEAEKQLKRVSERLSESQASLAALTQQQQTLDQQLSDQTAAAETARSSLAALLRSRFTNGRVDYLKSVLNQENPYALGRYQHYQGYLQRALRERYNAVSRQIQEVLATKASLLDQTQKIEEERTSLEVLRARQKEQTQKRAKAIARLDTKIKGAQSSLKTLQADRTRLKALLVKLKEQAKKLRQLEQARPSETRPTRPLVKGGFANHKGRLSCPISTKPSRKFGARLPESGMRSDGLFYSTSGSKPVSSIFSGRVLFADFLKGYGLLIIIDHGDDHISLYGHNARLRKKVGDRVDANEVIADTGVTGGLKSHGLYFEIRRNALPVDPLIWCR